MNIQELPDYFALQHLSQSLWRNGESRGAALFVGAGSSRFAELAAADTTKPPLWSSLRAAMAGVIYPGASEGDIPADPLRLAEEYRALLGQAALDDFIRHQVPDHAWKPSEIHARLLRLPWADVLSTNWDTLLERAARSVGDREYEVISVIEDIARAKSPRIVKLHGSLPAGPFIFAEEDYRTYPTKHAPLVNLARQVFLENEFCLIGFSGTDPNFLQWSGWVRDHLGESARRIYLVAVLNLRPAARRLLEDRNVAPIDFGPLVRPLEHDRQHLEAIKLFLAYLENSKPRPIYDWSANLEVLPRATTQEEIERPYKDKAYAASLLDMAATTWEAERNRYPGWIVCPSSKRDSLRTATSVVPMPLAEVLDHLPEKRRPRILYELAWRFEVSFWPVPDFLVTPLQGIAAPTANSGLSGEEHLEVAVLLLRNAREHSDQSRFDSLLSIIKDVSDPGSDARATAIYQQCLWARDHLDFARLASLLPELTGNDPIWGLRRAALHCDLGEYEDADALVIRTLDDLRSRQQLDRRSLWVLSRRAWAQFLDGAAVTGGRSSRIQPAIPVPGRDEWPLEFKAMKADPWDELRAVEDEIDAVHRESAQPKEPIKPHFEAGVYSETDGGLRFRSWSITPPGYALERLEETAGIPINFEMASILRTASERYVELQFEPSTNWYLRLIRVLRSHSDNLIERYFNRISIARLSSETVSVLLAATVGATYFWRQRSIRIDSKTGQKRFGHGTIARIQLYLEIVSRLAVRASEADARK